MVALGLFLAATSAPAAAADIVYLYDPLGRLVRVIDPAGEAATYVYDSAGNIVQIARQSGVPQDLTTLEGVTPTSAAAGSQVALTFTGVNLAGAGLPGLPNCLSLVSTELAVVGARDELTVTLAIDADCPLGAQPLSLVSSLGATALSFSLEVVQPPPRVDTMLPPIVATGGLVQLEGVGFDDAGPSQNQVSINGIRLPVVRATRRALIAQVVPGVSSGPVEVTTAAGSGQSASPLTVVVGTHPERNVVTATLAGPFRGPSRVVVSPDGARAYVLNTGRTAFGGPLSDTSGSVTAVDTAQLQVVKVAPVPGAAALSVTPDGQRVLVATTTPAGLAVVDAAALTVQSPVAYTSAARDVVVSADGHFAYVGLDQPAVSVIDLASLTEVARVPLARAVAFLALTPDGGTLYAIRGDFVSVIDTASRQVTQTISLAVVLNLTSVVLDAVARRLYVGGFTAGSGFQDVEVIDLQTGTVLRTISNVTTVALSPDRSRLYLAGSGATLTALDPQTLDTVATAAIGQGRPTTFSGQAMLTSPDGATLWVVNSSDNTLSVLEALSLTPRATVPVGAAPAALGLASLAGRSDLYVLNSGDNTVTTLDAATGELRASVLQRFGLAQPLGSFAPPGSPSVLVANGAPFMPTTVAFDAATGAGLATLPFGDQHPGIHLAASLGRSELYVGSAAPAGVQVLDLSTRQPKRLLPLARPPRAMALSLDERRLYAATDLGVNVGARVSTFDAASGALLGQLTLDGARTTDDMVLDPDGKRLYVLHPPGGGVATGTVRVMDTVTSAVVATIQVSTAPVRLALTPHGRRLYAIGSGSVSVVDTVANQVVATIAVDSFSINNLVFSIDGSKAYLGGIGVKVIDTATSTVTASLPAGFVRAVALSPDGQRLFATAELTAQTTVIDTATDQVVATLAVGLSSAIVQGGPRPVNVTFSPDGARAWITNLLDDSVSVIE